MSEIKLSSEWETPSKWLQIILDKLEEMQISKSKITVANDEKIKVELGSQTPSQTIRFFTSPHYSVDNTLTMLRLIRDLNS